MTGGRGATAGRAVVLAAILAAGSPGASPAQPRLETVGEGDAIAGVTLVGLEPRVIRALERAPAPGWSEWLSLHVGDRSRPPAAARYRIAGERVRLAPRFPLEPGLDYVAVFRPRALATALGLPPAGEDLELAIRLPEPAAPPTAHVAAVHPSGPEVPENLLKLYLHFSAPMSRGQAYRHVRIVDPRGEEVELAFVELEYELWDPAGRRLTLLFDPGRIKRGLVPQREVGSALEGGFDYALEVDASWPDAEGNPLREGFRQVLRITPPDHEQPDPATWVWTPPRAGTREPLVIDLGEPLDHALLQHSIWIVSAGADAEVGDAGAALVEGEVEVVGGDRIWRFVPDRSWAAARHELRVDPLLEDLAGNSVARPFEVDLAAPRAASDPGAPVGPWRQAFVPAG